MAIARSNGRGRTTGRLFTLLCALVSLGWVATIDNASAQRTKRDRGEIGRGQLIPIAPAERPAAVQTPEAAKEPTPPRETVQADVSTRNVAVTSSFTGTEIIVFGAVDNSQQATPEAGLYDVVVVIEGGPSQLAARRKSRVGGIWINTQSQTFSDVPSYYAIVSTRPLDDLAAETTLIAYEIGFDHVRMTPLGRDGRPLSAAERPPAQELAEFREAVVRLKKNQGLYVESQYGVAFIGRSLFRANIALPANVPVGPFETRVYLFKHQELLSQFNVRILLERGGFERAMYDFAMQQPLAYGIMTVILAVLAGLGASAVFRKGSH